MRLDTRSPGAVAGGGTGAVIRVSPREYQLVTERLLRRGGLPRELTAALLEHVLDAEIATGAALRHLYEHPGQYASPLPPAVCPATDGAVIVCGAGAPALLCAPAVLDLLLERGPLAAVEVRGGTAPELLFGLVVSGTARGMHIRVRVTGPSWAVAVRGEAEPVSGGAAERFAGGPARRAAERGGVQVPAELWHAACRRSHLAGPRGWRRRRPRRRSSASGAGPVSQT